MAQSYLIILIVMISVLKAEIQSEMVVIETPVGNIRGQVKNITQGNTGHIVTEFLGIPYAESTAGSKRFTKPVKKAPFSLVFNATNDFIHCPMDVFRMPGTEYLQFNEDCLVLNVIVPGRVFGETSLPVMIWIYGGGFQAGLQYMYVAPGFAAQNQVVLVTLNYRMSIYGFLANKELGLPGNYGLWDQHMAIQWVHDNIASFGGDPNRVVLFGESAGAASVLYQAMYTGNKGLIHGIIAQSGSPNTPWAFDKSPMLTFNTFLKKTSCESQDADELVECLRQLEMKSLLPFLSGHRILPVLDGDFITISPEELFTDERGKAIESLNHFRDLNVMIGFNSYEIILIQNKIDGFDLSGGLSLKNMNISIAWFLRNYLNREDAAIVTNAVLNQYYPEQIPHNNRRTALCFFDLLSDSLFIVPIVEVANAHAREKGNGKLYMYLFDYRPSFSKAYTYVDGAIHGDDIPFVLGFPLRYQTSLKYDAPTQDDIDLSNDMMSYWTQFAKTGNPNSETLPEWIPYTLDRQKYIVFQGNKTNFDIRERPKAREVYFWNSLPNISPVISGVPHAKSTCLLVILNIYACSFILG